MLESIILIIDHATNENALGSGLVSLLFYLLLTVRDKLKQVYVKSLGFPIKISSDQTSRFEQLMQPAMIKYKIDEKLFY